MSTINPFDRVADAHQQGGMLSPEEQWTQDVLAAERQGELHALMALAFLAMLKTTLSHEEALYLTAQIWRAG